MANSHAYDPKKGPCLRIVLHIIGMFNLELVNLCISPIFVFCLTYGDVASASVIMEALDEFMDASGLIPSIPKSTAYFCNVLNHTKLSILQVLPFEEGKRLVKYLGVPLVSSRLKIRDCLELVDKVSGFPWVCLLF
ncbi:hypothetical protein Tco_0720082 [Tanacetum coccineum]